MPHLQGWTLAGSTYALPAVGLHQVLWADAASGAETGRTDVAGQPVFVTARPDGRELWVNFATPDNGTVQVIDGMTREVKQTLQPGKGILHMEFTPRGREVWLSARDDDKVVILDTRTYEKLGIPEAERNRLVAGVAAQYESEVVYHQIREDLERQGVIAGYTVRVADAAEHGRIRAHILVTVMPRRAAAPPPARSSPPRWRAP